MTFSYIFKISLLLFGLSCYNVQAQETSGHSFWNRYFLTENLANFHTILFDNSSNKLYIGGVNKIYEFDPQNVTRPPREISWSSEERVLSVCLRFIADPYFCQNTIRVLVSLNDTHLYACGTMALKPQCIYISKETFTQVGEPMNKTRLKCPRNPYEPTVSVVANRNLFTATRMNGFDVVISRTLNEPSLTVKGNDKYWINDPHFISGYFAPESDPLQNKVMFFFREKAEEFQPYLFGMSDRPNDRNVVSRVATVCANDNGGTAYVLNKHFATYAKKTIVCNAPGSIDDETTFQYTHLESTFELPNEADPTGSTIYGIFTMPNNAIAGSAICAYKMNDIRSQLGVNLYWNRNPSSEGLKTTYQGDAASGPGRCVTETKRLSQTRLTFGGNHPIKFGYLQRSQNTPFYQESGTRFSNIVVDKVPSHRSSLGKNATVLYMITTTGLLKRVVFVKNNDLTMSNWTLPDIQIVNLGLKEMVIKMEINEGYLYVVTNLTLVQMPLAACNVYKSCDQCKDSHDPYCTINPIGKCDATPSRNPEELRQPLTLSCPRREEEISTEQEQTSEQAIIQQLQARVSFLSQRNAENERALEQMENGRDEVESLLMSCNENLEEVQNETSQLYESLSESQQALLESQENYTSLLNNFETCVSTRKFFMDHAIRLALEMRRRPSQEEIERNENQLIQARDGALRQLQVCQSDKRDLAEKVQAYKEKLRVANLTMRSFNTSCQESLLNQQNDFNAQMQNMNQKLAFMREAERRAERTRNFTAFEMKKKLNGCLDQNRDISNSRADSIKTSKILARQVAEQKRHISRLTWLFRRFRNQHECIDGTRWYRSNSTNSMYMFSVEPETFSNAERNCELINASLAIITDDQDMRFITTTIHEFEPSYYYWIGMVKNTQGSLLWRNNSPVTQYRSRIIESALATPNRTTYCARMSGSENWELANCEQRRRYICQRVRPTTVNLPTTNTDEPEIQ